MKAYKFNHTKKVVIQTNLFGVNYSSNLLTIDKNGVFTIHCDKLEKGYSWDGCTFKFYFIDLVWGVPDGRLHRRTLYPKTYFCSMVHDVIYQHKDSIPVSRYQADMLFRDMLNHFDWMHSSIYYRAVRLFGGLLGKWEHPYSGQDVQIKEDKDIIQLLEY